eukprot:symbB.v1.2.008153.t1/scaffold510.1/size193565/3
MKLQPSLCQTRCLDVQCCNAFVTLLPQVSLETLETFGSTVVQRIFFGVEALSMVAHDSHATMPLLSPMQLDGKMAMLSPDPAFALLRPPRTELALHTSTARVMAGAWQLGLLMDVCSFNDPEAPAPVAPEVEVQERKEPEDSEPTSERLLVEIHPSEAVMGSVSVISDDTLPLRWRGTCPPSLIVSQSSSWEDLESWQAVHLPTEKFHIYFLRMDGPARITDVYVFPNTTARAKRLHPSIEYEVGAWDDAAGDFVPVLGEDAEGFELGDAMLERMAQSSHLLRVKLRRDALEGPCNFLLELEAVCSNAPELSVTVSTSRLTWSVFNSGVFLAAPFSNAPTLEETFGDISFYGVHVGVWQGGQGMAIQAKSQCVGVDFYDMSSLSLIPLVVPEENFIHFAMRMSSVERPEHVALRTRYERKNTIEAGMQWRTPVAMLVTPTCHVTIMVNAETEARPDSPGGGSRLPLQLGRLPGERLERVHQAMEELKDAGLEELRDIKSLASSVKASSDLGNAKIPPEDLTTEYMGMTLWAWTPKRWFENIKAMPDPAGTKSDELQHEEGDQLPPVPDKVIAKGTTRATWNENFKSWFDSMRAAEAEIRSMATMDTSVKHTGDGAGVCFDQTAPIQGFGALPRPFPERPCRCGAAGFASRRGYSGSSKPWKPNTAAAIITLHMDDGLAGLDAWTHIMGEHAVDASGRLMEKEFYGCKDVLFSESFTGRYLPRAILAGETSAMESVEQAASRFALFHPDSIVAVSEGCNIQEACLGKEVKEIYEAIRLQLERADYMEGFLLTQSHEDQQINDWLSSGLMTNVMEHLSLTCGKKLKIVSSCIPDAKADPSKSGASAAISSRVFLEHADLVVFHDAVSAKKVVCQKDNGFGLEKANDSDARGITSRILSGLTGPMRFGRVPGATPSNLGFLGQSLGGMKTPENRPSLLPYPRVKFTFASLGGLGSPPSTGMPAGYEAANAALWKGCLCTANADRSVGKTISSTLICRGVEHSMALSPVISKRLDYSQEWTDYSKGSVSISSFKDPRSDNRPFVTMLENSTRAKLALDHQMKSLELEPGPEEANEVISDLQMMIKDYEDVEQETQDDNEEDEEECEEY